MEQQNPQKGGFLAAVQPALQTTGRVFAAIGKVIRVIALTLFHMRKLFMAAPVVLAAMRLATMTKEALGGPFRFFIMDVVASWQQSEMVIRQVEISQEVAVAGPMLVTCACLGLMFLSRRTVWPWLVSIFSLVIPVFIILSATYLPI